MLVALSLALGAGATLFYLVRSEPEHWQDYQAFIKSTTPQQREQLVEGIEKRLQSLVTDQTQSSKRDQQEGAEGTAEDESSQHQLASAESDKPVVKTIFLTADEVNAYVAEKFHDWLQYRDYDMPSELSEPAVGIADGRMLVSFEFLSRGFSQIFTAGFEIQFIGGGQAELQLTEVSAGQLSLSPDGLGDYLREDGPDTPALRRTADWLDKLDKVEFKPSMKLGDHHKAYVLDYKIREDGLLVTVKIERRPDYSSQPQIAAVAVETP